MKTDGNIMVMCSACSNGEVWFDDVAADSQEHAGECASCGLRVTLCAAPTSDSSAYERAKRNHD